LLTIQLRVNGDLIGHAIATNQGTTSSPATYRVDYNGFDLEGQHHSLSDIEIKHKESGGAARLGALALEKIAKQILLHKAEA
jgi:hypothetical protein